MALTIRSWFTGPRDLDAALGLVEEAVALAREAGDEEALAVALAWLGDIARDQGTAQAANEEVLALADRLRGRTVRYSYAHPDALTSVTANHLAMHAQYRSVRSAIAWQERALAVARKSSDPRDVARDLAELASHHLLTGDLVRAVALFDQVRSRPDGRDGDFIALASAQLLRFTGRPVEAEEAARALIAEGLKSGRVLHAHKACCLLADLLLDRDEVREVDAVLREAEGMLADSPDLRHVTRIRARQARFMRLTGRFAEALEVLVETEKGLDSDALSPELQIWLVEHALLADEPEEARVWADRLERLSERTGVQVPPWERRLLDGLDI